MTRKEAGEKDEITPGENKKRQNNIRQKDETKKTPRE